MNQPRGARILIVDDDQGLVSVISRVVVKMGHIPVKAYDGDEGWRRFQEGRFDMVITDLNMPGMDGMELARRVHGKDEKVATLIITGYGTISSADEALRHGVYDYLTKPFKTNVLEDMIIRVLERRALVKRSVLRRRLALGAILFGSILLLLIFLQKN
ncbi:MAG: response regulator [Deltaproteobacteria bacterium]|nr:response regulator [Deltaproteobacteria bacterium]